MGTVRIFFWENLPKSYKLTQLAPNPFPTDYRPELDTSPELLPEHASYYQSLMGIFRWMIELGCIDICTEVSMLSLHMALPCQGHLEAALHVMSYLSRHTYHYTIIHDCVWILHISNNR